MTQPALRTPALDARARAALATEFARALESPGLRPLLPRLRGALLPRFARYYDQLLHLPRRTRRELQRRWKRSLAALALLLALGQAPPALAADFDIPCSGGVGDAAALIQAINDANNGTTNPDPDSITLGANCTHTLTAVHNTTYGASGLPVISSAITIEGHGSTIKRDSADPDQFRIFAIKSGGNLTLNETTVSGGLATGSLGRGGGVLNRSGGIATLTNSTVWGNSAVGDGGGVYNTNGSTVTLTNSTVSGNSAAGDGGGVLNRNGGIATLTNSTVSGNSAANNGGGVHNRFGILNLANTILANSPSGGDCATVATLNTSGVNLVEDGSCDPGAITGDPNLGPLAPNGGPTETHVLLTGSPAIDAVTGGSCPPPDEDQRGVTRPQGAHCDIGSFEVAFADLSVGKTDAPDPVLVRDQLTWTITVSNSGMSDATGVMLKDTLPASGFTFGSTSSTQGSCSLPASGVIDCDLGNLLNGSTATVTIKGTPTAEGTLSNTVEVLGKEFDDNLDNNTATQTTTVAPLLCNGLTPTIVRDSGNNTITGTNGNDVIHGLGGNDTINGGNGNDTICGGEGTDTLHGGNGNDRLFGENGKDTLNGNNGTDALDGGAEIDTCNGGNGSDTGATCEPFNQ